MCIVIFFFFCRCVFSEQCSGYTFIKCTLKYARGKAHFYRVHEAQSNKLKSDSSSSVVCENLHGVPDNPQETARPFFGSYRIKVWDSVSMEGGPLVRRDGFTNTP